MLQAAPTPRAKPRLLYALYCLITFTALAVAALTVTLFVPGLRRRRTVAAACARGFFRVAGVPIVVEGAERLPAAPCVLVANHASYLDGLVACAVLPPDFAFVIKKEMVHVPLASLLLRRLGSEFVERHDRHRGAVDARRVLKAAAGGQSLVFFPKGLSTPPQRSVNSTGVRLRPPRACRCRSWRSRYTGHARHCPRTPYCCDAARFASKFSRCCMGRMRAALAAA